MADRVCVGAIAGSFGVKGEVRLKSFCADPEAIGTYGALVSEDGARSWEVRLTRPVKAGFAARLSGVSSKEAALFGGGDDLLWGQQVFVWFHP